MIVFLVALLTLLAFTACETETNKTYKVTYDLNYEGATTTTLTVMEGEIVNLYTPAKRTGFTFEYWSLEKNGAEAKMFPVKNDVTLYAIWSEDDKVVDFTQKALITIGDNEYSTFEQAYAAAKDEPIVLGEGTVYITGLTSFDKSVKIEGAGADKTRLVIDNYMALMQEPFMPYQFLKIDADNVSFKNVDIRVKSSFINIRAIVVASNTTGFEIIDSSITSTDNSMINALEFGAGCGFTVKNATFSDVHECGIYFSTPAPGSVIENSVFDRCKLAGDGNYEGLTINGCEGTALLYSAQMPRADLFISENYLGANPGMEFYTYTDPDDPVKVTEGIGHVDIVFETAEQMNEEYGNYAEIVESVGKDSAYEKNFVCCLDALELDGDSAKMTKGTFGINFVDSSPLADGTGIENSYTLTFDRPEEGKQQIMSLVNRFGNGGTSKTVTLAILADAEGMKFAWFNHGAAGSDFDNTDIASNFEGKPVIKFTDSSMTVDVNVKYVKNGTNDYAINGSVTSDSIAVLNTEYKVTDMAINPENVFMCVYDNTNIGGQAATDYGFQQPTISALSFVLI